MQITVNNMNVKSQFGSLEKGKIISINGIQYTVQNWTTEKSPHGSTYIDLKQVGTIYNWNEMTDGEKNALIHERIFGKCGHHIHSYPEDNQDQFSDYTNYRCAKCGEGFRGLMYREGMYVVPNYLEDMNAAWKIVTEMSNKESKIGVSFNDGLHMLIWLITPETICISALRALDVEIEGI